MGGKVPLDAAEFRPVGQSRAAIALSQLLLLLGLPGNITGYHE